MTSTPPDPRENQEPRVSRIDYRYATVIAEGDLGDEHAVGRILTIDLGSH
jgi:hypothetical protein